ncbi:putative monooxygenase [Colletotrichum sp. SAR 10_75]|nr:putative monooxygenase [Colletotrichum sp. SAR 10_75]
MITGQKPHVLIIGAGIGGLTLAQLLRKRKISFEIFEKDPEARTSGWCISLHSMLEELRTSVSDDMAPLETTSHLVPFDLPAQSVIYPSNDPDVRFGATSKGPNDFLRCNRERLRQWLSTNVTVNFNKRLSSIEETSDGVAVQFHDGSSATGDIVVGADGVHSAVRKYLCSGELPKHLPLGVIGGELTLGGRDMEIQLEQGHSTHTVFLPEESEDATPKFITLFTAMEKVHPSGDAGDFYWALTWRDENAESDSFWTKSASQEDLQEFAKKLTRNMRPEFRDVIERTAVDRMLGNPFPLRTFTCPELREGRVTLLGDAAHCMPPFGGQGGVQAIIDALLLAKRIREIGDQVRNEDPVKKGLSQYQDEMIARGNDAVLKSLAVYDPNAKRFAFDRKPESVPKEQISLQHLARV